MTNPQDDSSQTPDNDQTPQPGARRRAVRSDRTPAFRVSRLEEPVQLIQTRKGRPPKLSMPPLPQGLLDGMSPLEQEHFHFFIAAITRDYGITKDSDFLALHMAALEYVQLLRVQAKQLADGEVITAARQHPGVQLRAWLDSLSTTRRARKETSSPEDEERALWNASLKKLSS